MTIDGEIIDAATLIDGLADLAAASDGSPQPMAAGTFVLYPMDDGGVMFVLAVQDGPMAGTQHVRLAPAMIRAASALMGGGSKLSALKALTGRRRRGE